MKTRLLDPSDVDAYRRLRLAGIMESPGVSWASHQEEASQPLEAMRQRLVATPHQMVFGGFLGEQLVAIGAVKREAMVQVHHRANIWGLYVAPEARGQGVAGELLGAMMQHLRQIPELVQITLVVSSDNRPAKSLYAKFGFIQTGVDRRSVCLDGEYHDEDRMVYFFDAGK